MLAILVVGNAVSHALRFIVEGTRFLRKADKVGAVDLRVCGVDENRTIPAGIIARCGTRIKHAGRMSWNDQEMTKSN